MDPSRYARLEDERRFLVAVVPDGATSPRHIEDRYVTGTRLRLRRATDERGSVLKLGHKRRCDEGRPSTVRHTTVWHTTMWHTTMYLDDSEYAKLTSLDARTLQKRRWPPPAFEVTADERFCGGALAALDVSGAAALEAEARGRPR